MNFKTVGIFIYLAILSTILALPLFTAAQDVVIHPPLTFDDEIAAAGDCLADDMNCEQDIAAAGDCPADDMSCEQYITDAVNCLEDDEDCGSDAAAVVNCLADDTECEEYGQDFSSLFEDLEDVNAMFIDTSFAWHNKTINSGRFDYKTLAPDDIIKIPLVDSSQNKIYAHPFANNVTSRFGLRGYQWHYGIDVKLRTGDPVKCALDGIVRAIQFDRAGYGNVVVVRHHNGLETLYGHLSKVLVKANQPISAGEILGLGGNTGRSTGSHLHFEIRYYGEAFNPEYIIDFDNYTLKSNTLLLTSNNFEYLTEARKTVYYTVRSGDNLGAIARRHGTTVNNLCRLNGITPQTILKIGRKLVVRSGSEADRQTASNTSTSNKTSNKTSQTSDSAKKEQTPKEQTPVIQAGASVSAETYHTVRAGENLSVIAKRYGTTVSDLCSMNGITPQTVIKAGRILMVGIGREAERQAVSKTTATTSADTRKTQSATAQTNAGVSADVHHTVRNGDNLSVIAKRYGTTVNSLCRLNGITPQAILKVGRILTVK